MANNVNLQNIKFPELLSCDVKRLTRPRFNHEFPQLNDRMAFTRLTGEAEPSHQQPADAQTTDLLDLGETSHTQGAASSSESTKGIEILDIEEDYDPQAAQSDQFRDQQWNQLGANRHDISYGGIPADCALNYISTFGKISTGENFRVLFTI